MLWAVTVVSAVRLHSGVTHMPDMHRMDGRNNVICHWLIEVHELFKNCLMLIMLCVMLTHQPAAAGIICQLFFHHSLTCLLTFGASACLFIWLKSPVNSDSWESGFLVVYLHI